MVGREEVKQAGSGLVVRGQPPGAEAPAEPSDREERAANAFDRYSLVLQLIQVFPIISEFAVLFVANTWLARTLAGVGLLVGTVWVVQMERSGGMRALRRRAGERQARATELIDSGRLSAEVVGENNEINISIRLRSTPTVVQAPVQRGRMEPPEPPT